MSILHTDFSPTPLPNFAPRDMLGIMCGLSRRVAQLRLLIPLSRPVVYLDYPVHTNIGDLLIEKGTEHFFSMLGYNVVERRSAYDFGPRVRSRVPQDATILLHGGGNFGDLYELHQAFRASVIATFPRHRIVMLPQTLHFESRDRLAESAKIFAQHRDLHVCLRDQRSYDIFCRHFSNPAYLVPDMAHCLWDPFTPIRERPRGTGRLIFARKDKEQCPMPDLGDGAAQPQDWWDLLAKHDKLAYAVFAKLHVNHDKVGANWPLNPAWQAFRDHLIVKAQRLLDDYDTVVTNRLHMAILALLLGRKVVMADNSYGKLSHYHDTWLRDSPDIEFTT